MARTNTHQESATPRQSPFRHKMDYQDNTHSRKGKWRKPHNKAAKKDKRTARCDPVPEDDETLIPLSALTLTAKEPVCTEPTPRLDRLYAAGGYEVYMDYLSMTHCTCPSCRKQQSDNIAWIKKHQTILEDAEEAYIIAKERQQEEREAYHFDWMQRYW
jgi:hypothetical protein